MSLVLVHAYRFKPDRDAWLAFAQAWLRHGYRMVFWSNAEQGTLGLPFLPLVFSEREYLFYRLKSAAVRLDESTKIKWRARERAFQDDYGVLPFNYNADKMAPLIESVFEKLQPAIYLTWAGLEPQYGIARDVASNFGIPTAVIEKGLIGQTKMLDFEGIMGLCSLCEPKLEDMVAPDLWETTASRGKAFISGWIDTFQPRSKLGMAGSMDTRLPCDPHKQKVLVIGCLDCANGMSYPDDLKTISLPGYRDGFDIALQAAQQIDGLIVYKPHPAELPKNSWKHCPPNLTISDANTVNAIEWADIVIGYGSSVDLLVAAKNKPLILAGRSFLLNKGIAYEALYPEDLLSAVEAASKAFSWLERRYRLDVFFGFLLNEYLFNNETGGPARQSMADMVAKIVQRFDLVSATALSRRETISSVRLLLSNNGRAEIYWPGRILKMKRFTSRIGRFCARKINWPSP